MNPSSIEKKLGSIIKQIDCIILDSWKQCLNLTREVSEFWLESNTLILQIIDFLTENQKEETKNIFMDYPFSIFQTKYKSL